MPKVEADDRIRKWVEDWQGQFSTDYDEEALSGLVQQNIVITRPGDEETYELHVVGYSKTVLIADAERAVMWSILTADGKMIQLQTGVKIEMAD